MSGQREREALLLGLDQAFASAASSSGPAARAGARGGSGVPGGAGLAEDEERLYGGLPTTVVQEMEGVADPSMAMMGRQQRQGARRSSVGSGGSGQAPLVDAALQSILAPGSGGGGTISSIEERLRGRTVLLDNTRAQTEQQRQEVRARRQLLRGRVRLGTKAGAGSGRAGAYADYLGLHAAWKAYMARLLGIAAASGDDGGEGGNGDGDEDGERRKDMKGPAEAEAAAAEGEGMDEDAGLPQPPPQAGSGTAVAAAADDKSTRSSGAASLTSPIAAAAGAAGGASKTAKAFSSLSGALAVERRVLSADLHGCLLRVVASKSPDDVGVEGLVVRESATAFHLMSRTRNKGDRVKVLPKAGRRFAFDLGGRAFVLHGNGLVNRQERVLASPLLQPRGPRGAAGGNGAGATASADRRLLKTTVL